MKYEVEIPEAVEKKIETWGLPTALLALFYQTLILELEEGELNGSRCIAPVVFQHHRLFISCPDTGQTFGYKLWVNETMKPGTRRVIEIQRLGESLFTLKVTPPSPGNAPFTIE